MWQRGPRFSCEGKWVASDSLQTSHLFSAAETWRLTNPFLFLLQLLLPPPQHRPMAPPLRTLVSPALYQSPHRQIPRGKLCSQDQISPTTKAPAFHSEYQLLLTVATSFHEVSGVAGALLPSRLFTSPLRIQTFCLWDQRSILSPSSWKVIPASLVGWPWQSSACPMSILQLKRGVGYHHVRTGSSLQH